MGRRGRNATPVQCLSKLPVSRDLNFERWIKFVVKRCSQWNDDTSRVSQWARAGWEGEARMKFEKVLNSRGDSSRLRKSFPVLSGCLPAPVFLAVAHLTQHVVLSHEKEIRIQSGLRLGGAVVSSIRQRCLVLQSSPRTRILRPRVFSVSLGNVGSCFRSPSLSLMSVKKHLVLFCSWRNTCVLNGGRSWCLAKSHRFAFS